MPPRPPLLEHSQSRYSCVKLVCLLKSVLPSPWPRIGMFCALAATRALRLLFTLEENLINSLTDQINIHSNSSSCLENIKALMWHHLVARRSHLHFPMQSPFSFQITLYMTVNDICENCQIFLMHLWSVACIRWYMSPAQAITATKWNNRIFIHADLTNLYLHFTLFFRD